jgi:hypothetical protein
MASDEERLYEAVGEASARARQSLGQARSRVATAEKPFKEAVGWLSWGSVNDKLKKSRAYAKRYEELLAALQAADVAIARAEAACHALGVVPKP